MYKVFEIFIVLFGVGVVLTQHLGVLCCRVFGWVVFGVFAFEGGWLFLVFLCVVCFVGGWGLDLCGGLFGFFGSKPRVGAR